MHTTARVSPRALAAAATSGSAMKQRTCPPSLASAALLEPDAAQAVSHAAYQQTQLDLLARGVREALDMEQIYRVMEGS